MPVAADDRDRVWNILEEAPHLLNGGQWIDFYVLLELPRHASAAELEDAIISRGADVLTLSLARGVPERMRLLARYLPDLRLIFLDPAARARYDEQLRLHERGFNGAVPFDTWCRTSLSRVARLKQRSTSWARRVLQNVWDSEYV